MEPLVIKLGGVLLDSEEALGRLFTALAAYRRQMTAALSSFTAAAA